MESDVINQLKSISVDDLTPREALDFIYKMKELLK